MKKINIILLMLVSLGSIATAQQHKAVDIQLDVLEKNGPYVNADYTVLVNTILIASCQSVFLNPFLKNGDSLYYFQPVVINGTDRRRTYDRWIALHGHKTAADKPFLINTGKERNIVSPFDTQLSYREWMKNANLYVEQTVWKCGDFSREIIELGTLVIADEPVAVFPVPEEAAVKMKSEKRVEKAGKAYIDFPVGSSMLDINFGRNKYELAKINASIRQIEKIDHAQIIEIALTGYASLDGSYALNEKLSRERAQALADYISVFFDLNLSPGQLLIAHVAEDWDGFARLVEQENVFRKDEIIGIIHRNENSEWRKKRLTELDGGRVYRILKKDIFPLLRRTEYKVTYLIKE
ncbi:MAG TPA: hypothetical protein DDW85_13730 [Porphyromonadaceae bacterium]|nr:hypothetical protein [Porphyromonadaceae bacterium]